VVGSSGVFGERAEIEMTRVVVQSKCRAKPDRGGRNLVAVPGYRPEARSVELSPNVTAELNDKGDWIGIEILRASSFLRGTILESAQAKLLAVSSNESES